MTVQELIERLKSVPANWEVRIDEGNSVCAINSIFNSKYKEERPVVYSHGYPTEFVGSIDIFRDVLVLSSVTELKSCD